ncbi:MAG: cell division ATPase MinD [Candidatus Methanospirareceae archaeon]
MTTYAVASGKGGVGKTIFTLNAGAALAEMGLKTLIIDCDIGMADLGQMVDVDSKTGYSLHEVLNSKVNIEDVITHTSYGLEMILSSVSIVGFLEADMEKLREVIKDVLGRYDYILLDTATGVSQESLIPLTVCDEVILVINPELPSVIDAQKIRLIGESTGKSVRGVVINRVRGVKRELGSKTVEKMLELDILGVIPEDDNMISAVTSRTPLVIKKPNSPAAKAIKEVVKEMEGEKKEGRRLFWRKE